MKKIDFNTWDRKEIYEFVHGVSDPYYMATFSVDVTPLYSYVKAHDLSFYHSMIYLCSQALNSIDNFRYVIRNGEIYLLDRRKPSFTELRQDTELFQIITIPLEDNLEAFCQAAGKKRLEQKTFIDPTGETDDLIYYSCSPTLYLTAVTNERNRDDPAARESNIPSLVWGRFIDHNGRKELNLSMEVNHRFVDGIHIARFADKLSQLFSELEQ